MFDDEQDQEQEVPMRSRASTGRTGRRVGDPGGNRGGGPKTAEGLAVISARSTSHGLYRMMETGMAPGCDICLVSHLCDEFSPGGLCIQAARATEEVIARVTAAEHITPLAQDQVRAYGKLIVLLEVIDKHVQMDGLFRKDTSDGLHPSAIWEMRMRVDAAALNYAEKLGLTPAAQSRLRLTRAGSPLQGMLDLFAEVEEELRERREAGQQTMLEGEFEVEDGTAGTATANAETRRAQRKAAENGEA
jgi:hypothetical protein